MVFHDVELTSAKDAAIKAGQVPSEQQHAMPRFTYAQRSLLLVTHLDFA